jgi:predicted alpha/beta-fold hydrolase
MVGISHTKISPARVNHSAHPAAQESGGHLGFITHGEEYWSETRRVEFLREAVR